MHSGAIALHRPKPALAPRSGSRASLPAIVKSLRPWLLLLLAVLLPVRGAMAAAMLCPPAGTGSPAEVVVAGHDHAAHGHAAHDHAGHDPAGHARAGHAHAAPADIGPTDVSGSEPGSTAPSAAPALQDDCDLCSALCSVPTLLGSPPAFAAPHTLRAATLPDPGAPAPSFLSSGPERPPRSI